MSKTNDQPLTSSHVIKPSTAAFIALITFVIGFVAGMAVQRKYRPCVELPVVNITRDTVVVRDTIRPGVATPRKSIITRVDTVRLQINPNDHKYERVDTIKRQAKPDTARGVSVGPDGSILIPLSQVEYKTDDYRAVVEGYKPRLVDIELYPKVTRITETVTKLKTPPPKRWALTIGPGVGYGPDRTLRPFIGATVGLIVIGK